MTLKRIPPRTERGEGEWQSQKFCLLDVFDDSVLGGSCRFVIA